MNTLLITLPLEEEAKEDFSALGNKHGYTVVFREEAACTGEEYRSASIIVGKPPLSVLPGASSLRYLHLTMAGSNTYTAPGVLPEGVLFTNSTGAFGHAISEHALGTLFELFKKLHLYRDNQNASSWHDEGTVKSIEGSTCLVLGLGDIGSAFARRAAALGMRVSGMRRTTTEKPPYIESMYPMGSLEEIAGDFDVFFLALPETKDTVHLIDAHILSLMKKDAVIINVGRGSAIDTEALCDALEEGRIGGASLDVTDPEPLPADHRLWKQKNAVITPHVSGFFHLRQTYDNLVELAYRNVKAFLEGREPENIVDFETGYRRI